MTKRFTGTDAYVADDGLMMAVNAAITLEKPILVKGEPGTGKTMLAEQVAESLGAPFIQWHIKSTTKARQGLYEYDAVSRLRAAGRPSAVRVGRQDRGVESGRRTLRALAQAA